MKAHSPRFSGAHWVELLSREAAPVHPARQPVPPNQLIRHRTGRDARPIGKAVRSAPGASRFGGGTFRRTVTGEEDPIRGFLPRHRASFISRPDIETVLAIRRHPFLPPGAFRRNTRPFSRPSPALSPLMNASRSGRQRLRPLAPPLFAGSVHQLKSANPLGFARPFLPSSPSPKPRLRAEEIGGGNPLDPFAEVPEHPARSFLSTTAQTSGIPISAVVLPGPNDRQDSTFPRKVRGRVARAHFPAVPARVRPASGE